MLYLANCEITKTYYSGETEKIEMNHIVEAVSENNVKDKIEDFYSVKNDPYYLTYWVEINYCNEIISYSNSNK